LRYRIATREPLESGNETGIQITTLWGAKGLTAPQVYVIGLADEALPGQKGDGYPGTAAEFEAEQRRLFYVSLTRTKTTLVLSQVKWVQRTEGLKLGLAIPDTGPALQELTTSRFLQPILGKLPTSVPGADWTGCAPA
jgi:superfamily I DNA/RNA helicase